MLTNKYESTMTGTECGQGKWFCPRRFVLWRKQVMPFEVIEKLISLIGVKH